MYICKKKKKKKEKKTDLKEDRRVLQTKHHRNHSTPVINTI